MGWLLLRGRRWVAGLAGLLLVTAACDKDAPSSPPVPSENYNLDIVIPPQPYDILRGDDVGTVQDAQLRLRDQCLTDAGFPQSQEATGSYRHGDAVAGMLTSASTFGPTSEDEARRLGFGHDSPGEPAKLVSFDESFNAKLDSCGDEAWSQLGSEAQSVLYGYFDLINLLAPYPQDVPTRPDLVGQLFDCLVGKGYHGDRAAFLGANATEAFGITRGSLEPSPGVGWLPTEVPGTIQVGPAIPPRRYRPTAEEADLAVAWFQCDQQVHFVSTALTLYFQAQQSYVDRYETRITEENERITALAHTASAYLQALQP